MPAHRTGPCARAPGQVFGAFGSSSRLAIRPIVTIWRELRRGVEAEGDDVVQAAAQAANDGDWRRYTDAMGGPKVPR